MEARARIGNVETPFGSTYSWLFQGVVGFEDWLSGRQESPLYWIQGKPGSGKSTAMKFAMLHGETRKFLTRYHNSNWIITGFFFHDRGSDVQKSLSGCLREVLYQVIKAKPHLIRRLLKSHPNVVTFSGLGEDAAFGISWKPEELESALFSVASYEPLNLCLFIDALDEHEGNHRVLLAIINRLQTLNKDETCRLRLCLASRPESIFQQAFHRNPGFAIHEWTQSDILEYTNYRLKDIALDSEEQFLHLVEAIAEKACGVFVWVRLVADELIDGWCNGDSIHELMNTLSIIPPELEELYGRALRRSNRSDPHILMKYKHDAYVMFQLALCAREPLTLHEFFMVAQYCSRTAPTDAEHYMTLNQKLRRLHGRCFGLLEVVDTSEESVGLGGEVQFIHQTAKELFSQGKGFDVLYEGHEAMPIENGHTYLLEFLVSTVVDNRPFPIVDTRSILYHANRAENLSQKSSISYLREEFHRKSIPLQRQICTVLESVKLWDPLRNSLVGLGNHQLGFLVFSVWASLPLSVADCIQSLTQVPKRYAGIILRAAICAPKDFGIDSSTSALDILTLVLKTGMDADSVFADGETPFSTLINAEEDVMGLDSSSDIDVSKHGQVPKDADRKIDFLSTLVKFGADPNQMITGFPSNGGFAPATHIVLTESNPEVLLSALISSGADLSISDSEGFFALFYAIAWNEVECVRTLLWNGAHVCRLNSEGLCALAPNEERFGHNSLRIDFTRFENRCEMMMGLFLEVEMEHLEDCKFLESAQENKQPSGSKVQI